MPNQETALMFPCGHEQLVGVLHRPVTATARRIGVLIVVGGPQYRVGSHRQFVLMARCIAEAGYPVLRFDYRGMGDATGEARTFQSVDEDIGAAIKVLREEQPAIQGVVALGLCDGASAALIYSRSSSPLAGLGLMNPWVRTEEGAARAMVRHYYLQRLLQRSLWRKILGGEFRPADAFRDALRHLMRARRRQSGEGPGQPPESFLERMAQGARKHKGPILLLLSGRDLTAREFEDHCRESRFWRDWSSSSKVTRVKLHDADHTLSDLASLREACVRILGWLDVLEIGIQA